MASAGLASARSAPPLRPLPGSVCHTRGRGQAGLPPCLGNPSEQSGCGPWGRDCGEAQAGRRPRSSGVGCRAAGAGEGALCTHVRAAGLCRTHLADGRHAFCPGVQATVPALRPQSRQAWEGTIRTMRPGEAAPPAGPHVPLPLHPTTPRWDALACPSPPPARALRSPPPELRLHSSAWPLGPGSPSPRPHISLALRPRWPLGIQSFTGT